MRRSGIVIAAAIAGLLGGGTAHADWCSPVDGCRWVARYDSGRRDTSTVVEVSPDGSVVYTAGTTDTRLPTVVANDAATGERLWATVLDEHFTLWIYDGEITADGSRFVIATETHIAAFDTSTGALAWLTPIDPLDTGRADTVRDLAIAPDGTAVFFVGRSLAAFEGPSLDGIGSLDASDGTFRWWHFTDHGLQAVIAGDGVVFATGGEVGNLSTGAYRASDGAELWKNTRIRVRPGGGIDIGQAIALSPDGRRVVVAGQDDEPRTGTRVVTSVGVTAYDASDGRTLWTRNIRGRRQGLPNLEGSSFVFLGGVLDTGSTVVVGGRTPGFFGAGGLGLPSTVTTTAAIDPTSGTVRWRTDDHLDGVVRLAGNDDGSRVYVTSQGFLADAVVSGYDTASGRKTWEGRFNERNPYYGVLNKAFDIAVGAGRVHIVSLRDTSNGSITDFLTTSFVPVELL